jgi:hypothetical protein
MASKNYEYIFNRDRCPYKEVHDCKTCSAGCVRFMEMDYLIWSSGLPDSKRFPIPLVPEEVDLDAFKRLKNVKDDIVNFVNKQCIFLFNKAKEKEKKTN